MNGKFNLELMRAFSSMFNGKGLPEEKELEKFLGLECWQVNGEFNIELLRSFSSIFSSKGLPKGENVKSFIHWLPSDEMKSTLKLACRLFAGSGIPLQATLTKHIETLSQYVKKYCYSADNRNDNSDEDDDFPQISQMKALALFCSAPAKWHMTHGQFEQYLIAHPKGRNVRSSVNAALKSLFPILALHGGAGIQLWLEMHDKNSGRNALLTQRLSIPAPLALTKFALEKIPELEISEYLVLCKNLKCAPNQTEWDKLKPLREQLNQQFKQPSSKRLMFEILWSQSEGNRSKYAERMDELFKAVPTLLQWQRLHQLLGPKKMQQFMDACLDYQAEPDVAPGLTIQQRLLEGMLLTNHYLYEHKEIPDLCFSKREFSTDLGGVHVCGDDHVTGQERLWHFIAAMMYELQQVEYRFKNQQLIVSPPDGEPVVLPKLEFTLTDIGFVINNWSLEQLNAFFRATEFTEQWYKKPNDNRELWVIRRAERLAQMNARSEDTTEDVEKITALPPLPPSVIINIIKSNKSLKPAVWSSLKHYANNGQLTAALCKALTPVIQRDKDGVVPELIKNAVAVKQAQIDASKTAAIIPPQQTQPATTALSWNSVSNSISEEPEVTFDAAMEALDRFQVLGDSELEMLEPYQKLMGTMELMSVLKKINQHSVKKQTQADWYIALEDRKKDPLRLSVVVQTEDKGTPGLNDPLQDRDNDPFGLSEILSDLDLDSFMANCEPEDNNWFEDLV